MSHPAKIDPTPIREIVIDGVVYDADTGEEIRPHVPDGFQITDEASFEWAMEKILDADVNVTRAKLKQTNVAAELEKDVRKAVGRADWLRKRFGAELESYTSKKLEGVTKTKTIQSVFGKCSFRKKPGGIRVKDAQKAIDYATKYAPAALVTPDPIFKISLLDDVKMQKIERTLEAAHTSAEDPFWDIQDDAIVEAFRIDPDEETFSITTVSGAQKK